MHQLLPLKLKIGIIVILAAIPSTIASTLGWHPIAIGSVVAIVEWIVVVLLYKSWNWIASIPLIPRPAWMSVNLTGRWTGSIESQWAGNDEITSGDSIPVTVEIKQSWHEVAFTMMTAQMQSRTSGAIPMFDRVMNVLEIRYFFDTEPYASSVATNPPQRLGSGIARIDLSDSNRMGIVYTNERGVGGDIVLRRKSRRAKRK